MNRKLTLEIVDLFTRLFSLFTTGVDKETPRKKKKITVRPQQIKTPERKSSKKNRTTPNRKPALEIVDRIVGWVPGQDQRSVKVYKRVYIYETIKASPSDPLKCDYDVMVDLKFPMGSMENLIPWRTEEGIGIPIFKGDGALVKAHEFIDNWIEKESAGKIPTFDNTQV